MAWIGFLVVIFIGCFLILTGGFLEIARGFLNLRSHAPSIILICGGLVLLYLAWTFKPFVLVIT